MSHILKTLLIVLALATVGHAQSAAVTYDYSGEALAVVQGWAPTLYVNNTPFQQPQHTCVQAGTVVTCSFPLPDISTALTPTGPQRFEVSLRDAVLGEGPRSLPLLRTRPGAPIDLRFP